MKVASDATACLRTSFLSFVISADLQVVSGFMVSAAIRAATSTSTMRQLTVEVTPIMILSAEVACIFSKLSV